MLREAADVTRSRRDGRRGEARLHLQMMPRGSVAPASLWHAVTPPGPELPALAGDERCDVVVIGAGFPRLSPALHLAEAGIGTVVLEAAEPGFGASGRNNGQVIPTLSRTDPNAIVAR